MKEVKPGNKEIIEASLSEAHEDGGVFNYDLSDVDAMDGGRDSMQKEQQQYSQAFAATSRNK